MKKVRNIFPYIIILLFMNCLFPFNSNNTKTTDAGSSSIFLFYMMISGGYQYNSSSSNSNCISYGTDFTLSSCENAEVILPDACLTGSLEKGTMKFYKVNFTQSGNLSTFITPSDSYSVKNCQYIYKENRIPTTKSPISDLEDNQSGGTKCLGSSTATTTAGSFRCVSVQSFCKSNYTYKLFSNTLNTFTSGTITGTPATPTWSKSSATFTPINGISVPIFGNAVSAPIPIGFNFTLAGVTYTGLIVSSNGMIAFDVSSPYLENKSLSALKDYVLAPWWSSLDMDCNSKVQYKIDTTDQGNKILTIEWTNMLYYQYSSTKNLRRINFQLKLYQLGNVIEFVYGTSTGSLDSSVTYPASATGLRYYLGGVGGYINSITGISTGTTYSPDNFPDSGTLVRFTP